MKAMIVDIGSNTIKYDIFNEKASESIGHRSIAAGIIRYIQNGTMTDEGIETLCRILISYQKDANEEGVPMYVFATASLRRVSDPLSVIQKVKARTGIVIDLISGQRESSLSLSGMLHVTPHESIGLMMDMGGGSTELNRFCSDVSMFPVSCPFGALSLKNEFVSDVFPTKKEADAIYRHAKDVFFPHSDSIRSEVLYMVGGSAKAVCKLMLYKDLIRQSDAASVFDAERIRSLLHEIIPCGKEDEVLLKELFPDRYHVMLPALCAYVALLDTCGAKRVTVSKGGIREGYLLERIQQNQE